MFLEFYMCRVCKIFFIESKNPDAEEYKFNDEVFHRIECFNDYCKWYKEYVDLEDKPYPFDAWINDKRKKQYIKGKNGVWQRKGGY